VGIRGTLLAGLLLTCAPAAASAQGVPPPSIANDPVQGPKPTLVEQIVPQFGGANGPQVAAPGHTIPPGTPSISAPGAVPPQKTITAESKSRAENYSSANKVVGAGATLVEQGGNAVARNADNLADLKAGENLASQAKTVGNAAKVVGLAVDAKIATEKCTPDKGLTSDCVTAGLNLAGSAAGTVAMIPGGPAGQAPATQVLGKYAAPLKIAADANAAANACYTNYNTDQFNPAECVSKLADTTMSGLAAAAESNPVTAPTSKVITATYSIAKTVLPGAVDKMTQDSMGRSVGERLFDGSEKDVQTNADIEAATSPAAIAAHRAKLRAKYQQSKGNLVAKQQEREARQARLEAERQAAAQQAAQQAASAYGTQTFFNSLNAVVQPFAQGGPVRGALPQTAQGSAHIPDAKCGYPYVCWTPSQGYNTAGQAATRQAPAPSPAPSTNSGCGGTGPGTCR